jgi:hypothetical protein
MKAIVDRADAVDPKLNDAFREYAQARGFAVDPARVRSPRDKPRVERSVPYVRSNFFAGEDFRDLNDCRSRAEHWCGQVAGMRVHGTTRLRPAEVFVTDELPKLKPAPDEVFDIPPGPIPRWPRTGMCRSPRRSTAFPVSSSGADWMPVSTRTR